MSVPITLSEMGGIRYLHFGSEWVQGAMKISRPDQIVLDYVQQMMAWLLFLEPPARMLQLGLGAGALTRYCLAHCAPSDITVVELSEEVIDTARAWFSLPPDGPRLTVHCGDAYDVVTQASQRQRYGVVQVDLYDMHARGPVLDSLAFYRACANALEPTGVCVVNLFGEAQSYTRSIDRLTRVFEGRLIELPAGAAGNRVVLGFKGPPLQVVWRDFETRAARVQSRFGLPARGWARALREDRRGQLLEV